MKKRLTAKQLTIRYFSVVAIAIITLHFSVYEFTTDSLEYRFVQNRLDNIRQYLVAEKINKNVEIYDNFELHTQGNTKFDKTPRVLLNFDILPEYFPNIEALPYNKAIEVDDGVEEKSIYIMKVSLGETREKSKDAIVLIDNDLYELSEEQILNSSRFQFLISFFLMLVSLFAVVKISSRLSRPISNIANELSSKSPEDIETQLQSRSEYTRELEEMVKTFNAYQRRIQSLIERERSFNRYASHELRSPLMVMQGASNLLGESNDPKFIEKQKKRLLKACNEMSEFVETLLSLTRPKEGEENVELDIDNDLIDNIIENHIHILNGKDIEIKINIDEPTKINMPQAAFQILIGNIIKNAFAYTEEGEVSIHVSNAKICVIDTGKGFQSQVTDIEGYGLGLLLVRDISRRYNYDFELRKNDSFGSIATIFLE